MAKTPAKNLKKVTQSVIPAKAGTSPKKASIKVAVKPPVVKTPVSVVEKKPAPKKLGTYFYAHGKRKTSVASVRLFTNGKGTLTINERTFENYFPLFTDQDKVLSPLKVTNTQKLFDIVVKVFGGGVHSQADAVRHAVAKALLEYQADLRSTLKPHGFLTRDSRVKERKKYGLKRARRAPQWQKR